MGKISEAITAVFGPKSSEGLTTGITDGDGTGQRYKARTADIPINLESQQNQEQQNESCDSCRYISSGAMLGCSIYLVSALKRKPPPTYTLRQAFSHKFAAAVMAACLAVTAVFRFTETGPFDRKHDGVQSMMEADIKTELNDVFTKLGVVKQTVVDNKNSTK